MPNSPKYHGQPSTSKQKSSQPIKMFDGMFIQEGTLADETEDRDVLNWLYKDEEDTQATMLRVTLPAEQYGNGLRIMQRMGYS